MKDSDFEQLIASVKQAASIKRGEMEPSRTFEVRAEDMKVEPSQTPAPGVSATQSRDQG